jgi:Flp pilus assembly protein TadD
VESGDTARGIAQLREAVTQRPNYADAWFELSTILKQEGDVDGAIDALRHSVALDDKDAGAFNTLGLLLKRKGDEAGAKEAFARAAELRLATEQEKEKKLKHGAAQLNSNK